MCNRKTKFQELNTVSESESSLLPNLNNSHKFLRILWRKLMWNLCEEEGCCNWEWGRILTLNGQ